MCVCACVCHQALTTNKHVHVLPFCLPFLICVCLCVRVCVHCLPLQILRCVSACLCVSKKGPFVRPLLSDPFVCIFFFSFVMRSHLIVCTSTCVCPLYRCATVCAHVFACVRRHANYYFLSLWSLICAKYQIFFSHFNRPFVQFVSAAFFRAC